MIGKLENNFRPGAGPGTADEGAAAESTGAKEDVAGEEALRMHRADHDQIGPEKILVANFLEALIHQPDIPGWRTERGHGDESERRRHGGLGKHVEDALKPPENRGEVRPDHEHVEVASEGRKDRLVTRQFVTREGAG